jgi:Ca-activated chloride channel family protein
MKSLKSIYLKIAILHLALWTLLLLLFYAFGGFEIAPRCYFINPSYLILMGLMVPISLLFGWVVFKTDRMNWGKNAVVTMSSAPMLIQLVLISLVWYGLVIAAAMPIYGKEKAISSKANLELIICLDISKSMNVKDMQGSSRIEVAKRVISSLLAKSSGEQIGLCIYAGNAIREMELTRDYQLIRTVTTNLESQLIEQQGTDIGAAIQQAKAMFSSSPNSKSILLITDGENHEEDEQDNSIYASLNKEEIRICILGLGSSQGGAIPVDPNAENSTNLIDDNGTEWISSLGEESIKKIASQTGGSAIISNESYPDIEPILTQINLMKRENSRTLNVDVDAMRYKWFFYLAAASFCLLLLLPVLWRK